MNEELQNPLHMMDAFSANGEDLWEDDIETVIDYIIDSSEQSFVGEVVTISGGTKDCPEVVSFLPDLVEELSNNAYDNFSEHAGDWPSCSKEQEKELANGLKDLVEGWVSKHNLNPSFYHVTDIKKIRVQILSDDGKFKIIETVSA